MSRHVAFLRAINTTGRRTNNALTSQAFLNVGATFAQGFIASGNVIFDVDRPVDDKFIDEIEQSFDDICGFEIPAVVRSAEEVISVSGYRPFTEEEMKNSQGTLYVGFLKLTPKTEHVDQVNARSKATDLLKVHQQELYWLPTNGEFKSDISIPGIERVVGTMTMRVINTVDRIVNRFLMAD